VLREQGFIAPSTPARSSTPPAAQRGDRGGRPSCHAEPGVGHDLAAIRDGEVSPESSGAGVGSEMLDGVEGAAVGGDAVERL
jgi:hypothetical protein